MMILFPPSYKPTVQLAVRGLNSGESNSRLISSAADVESQFHVRSVGSTFSTFNTSASWYETSKATRSCLRDMTSRIVPEVYGVTVTGASQRGLNGDGHSDELPEHNKAQQEKLGVDVSSKTLRRSTGLSGSVDPKGSRRAKKKETIISLKPELDEFFANSDFGHVHTFSMCH